MKQQNIGFKDLLERLLPIDELPSAERLRVQRAMRSDIAVEVERAAMHAIELLEQQGAIQRIPPPMHLGGPVVRYQTRDRQDVITLHLPGPRMREGITAVAKKSLPHQAATTIEQARNLVRLDDSLFFSNPSTGTTRAGLRDQLDEAGRSLLGAGSFLFFPTEQDDSDPQAPKPIDAALAEDALKHPGLLFYCPDTERVASILPAARHAGARSVTITAVTGSDGKPFGLLEVHRSEVAPHRTNELALIALLAESAGTVLERARSIEKLVFKDQLTQVSNRQYYDLQMVKDLDRAKREGTSLALMLCDIDNFKSFNSDFGMPGGDEILTQVAGSLTRGVRPYDTVARWGGEEFVVLLAPHVERADALMIAERLREGVESTSVDLYDLNNRFHRAHVTISAGIALFPDHADTPKDLYRLANLALAQAKNNGKNQVVLYTPEVPPPIALLR